MTELHVNVDHVATLRQARRTVEPSPLEAVKILEKTDTDGITTHLREDRRHIQDSDIYEIDAYLRDSRMALTFEMGATEEIREICLKTKSKLATIVPEKREEVTTEGGMDLSAQKDYLKEFIKPIQANGTEISFFIDPVSEQVELAKEIGAEFIELHTGTFANNFLDGTDYQSEVKRLSEAAKLAESLGLKVNLGHGLTVANLPLLLPSVPQARELHIGHSLMANAIYNGLKDEANNFIKIIKAKALT